MIYGYARCSSRENLHLQDISRQFRELEKLQMSMDMIKLIQEKTFKFIS